MSEPTPPPMPFMDPDRPLAERVDDLVGRLTLEEKAAQMLNDAPAVPRLGIPACNWWNECLHGVARAGRATVFPQAIGMAAAFDAPLLERVADAISDEARAKHHAAAARGVRDIYFGLTYWTPNINIFRDPRWGRGQETYGEDPHLTGVLGAAFVRGLQGRDPRYLKLVATPKHYAVHSGPEKDRHAFDAVVSPRNLRETYLPAFRRCVREGGAWSVMGAYNRTNGEACCASRTLLEDILRREWGFAGYVVSDCGALADIHAHHRLTAGAEESAALAVRNGCDLECGMIYKAVPAAVRRGLLDEADVDRAVKRLFTARFKLGQFDPPERVPYAAIPPSVVGCARHRALALRMARESMVLIKNEGGLLPLAGDLRKITVVGPCANTMDALFGNYTGYSARIVTPLQGILGKVSAATQVHYAPGCEVAGGGREGLDHVQWLAHGSDVIVACLGLTTLMEGEEGDARYSDANGDRIRIGLPGHQEDLLRKLHATGIPVVLVLSGGSPLAVPWAAEHVPAILAAWYPGEEGGQAVADVLFGDYNPAGRLPVTFVRSEDQLPPFDDYDMYRGRTYRFLRGEPLFRFGHGLSFTRFRYANLRLGRAEIGPADGVTVRVEVENAGDRAGDEVVQLYVADLEASVPVPRLHLEGFRRIHLPAGRRRTVTFRLTPDQLAAWDETGRPFVEPGAFRISVGGGQPDATGVESLSAILTVRGR